MRIVPSGGVNEFMEHISSISQTIAKFTAITHIEQTGRTPDIDSITGFVFAALQGYMNGCLDMLNSEDKDQSDEYIIKLRKLILPVRIELEAKIRRIKSKDRKG